MSVGVTDRPSECVATGRRLKQWRRCLSLSCDAPRQLHHRPRRRRGARAAPAQRSKEEHWTKLEPQKRCDDAAIPSFSPSLAAAQGPSTVQTLHFLILTSDVSKTGLLSADVGSLFEHPAVIIAPDSSTTSPFCVLYFLPFSPISSQPLHPPPPLPPSLPLPLPPASPTFHRHRHGAAATGCKSRRHGNTSWSVVLVERRREMHPLLVARGGGIRQSNINFCRAHPPRFMLTQSLDVNC